MVWEVITSVNSLQHIFINTLKRQHDTRNKENTNSFLPVMELCHHPIPCKLYSLPLNRLIKSHRAPVENVAFPSKKSFCPSFMFFLANMVSLTFLMKILDVWQLCTCVTIFFPPTLWLNFHQKNIQQKKCLLCFFFLSWSCTTLGRVRRSTMKQQTGMSFGHQGISHHQKSCASTCSSPWVALSFLLLISSHTPQQDRTTKESKSCHWYQPFFLGQGSSKQNFLCWLSKVRIR